MSEFLTLSHPETGEAIEVEFNHYPGRKGSTKGGIQEEPDENEHVGIISVSGVEDFAHIEEELIEMILERRK